MDFRINYDGFHGDMKRFLDLIAERFTNNSPGNLRRVPIISDILRPNDSVFYTNLEIAIQRFFIVHDMLYALLERGVSSVVAHERDWFWEQRQKLEWLMFLVKSSILDLRLQGFCNDISNDSNVMSAGIGGINTNLQETIGYTLMKDIDVLVFALRQL